MEKDQDKILSDVTSGEYKYGFYSDIDMNSIPKGLSVRDWLSGLFRPGK